MVGLEVCRVNCGGVSAHLSGGWVVRTAGGEPVTRLVGVAILEGRERGVERSALERVRACEAFEGERCRRGVPDGVVGVEWVMHITSKEVGRETVEAVLKTVAEAVGVSDEAFEFRQALKAAFLYEVEKEEMAAVTNFSSPIEDTIQALHQRSEWTLVPKGNPKKGSQRDSVEISVLEVAPTISKEDEKIAAPFWNFTFMSTFDAVSEFTTSTPVSSRSSIIIGLLSLVGILTIHVVELWSLSWTISTGWILVMIGYIGIVFSVTCAAILVHRSCVCIKLDTGKPQTPTRWNEGMVVSVKNTDSMDTTGSNFVSSSSQHQNLEAVWIKPSTQHERIVASGVAVILVLAFISHYLGLRAMKWWASVGELGICLLASFARSVSNNRQSRFKVMEGVKVDKRCMSTGVIRTQTSRLVTNQPRETSRILDTRAYSPRSYSQPPTTGERVAFQTAKLMLKDSQLRGHLKKLTGMSLNISHSGQSPTQRAILASFSGGILLSEGIGFPNAYLCIAFQASPSDLASPTALLARAIMRQPEWVLTHSEFGKGIPLGNVYILSIQSMMDWWTLSEDRNDMGDIQKNLHWSMFLVNVAFFLEVLEMDDVEMIGKVEEASGEDESERKTAEGVVEFLNTAFEAI